MIVNVRVVSFIYFKFIPLKHLQSVIVDDEKRYLQGMMKPTAKCHQIEGGGGFIFLTIR